MSVLKIKDQNGEWIHIPSIIGEKGETGDKGDTGNGIASINLNDDYTLTITYTDGTTITTESIRGAQGEQGIQGEIGNGISFMVLNNDYTLTINYTNGTSYTTPSIRGEQGAQGIQGIQGIQGVQGETGETGADGTDGADGVGIASTVLNADYTLTITLTDGTEYTTGSIRGEQGEAGSDATATDVQINGTSITSNSVANIPLATTSTAGVMSATDKTNLDLVVADYSSALTALGVI